VVARGDGGKPLFIGKNDHVFDDCVGRVLDAVKRNDLEDSTIVIGTADHGDDLYEPGVTFGHGLTFNGGGQANHVPMIMHFPGLAPRVIPETVPMVDIMPTLEDRIAVPKPAALAGWMSITKLPSPRSSRPANLSKCLKQPG